MTGCERCGHGLEGGGLWHDGRRLCCDCAEVVAFWETVNYDGGGVCCEACGVTVAEVDACYLMAAVSCPGCFVAVAT